MKIALLSINMYTKRLNFACPIHTLAFQEFLSMHDFDCTVLDYKPVYYGDFDSQYPADYYLRLYNDLLKKPVVSEADMLSKESRLSHFRKQYVNYKGIYDERIIRDKKFRDFIDKHYKKTKICYTAEMLETQDPGFDCYICVTDVIWKKVKDVGYDRVLFLGSSTMENKLKISYAASCGPHIPTEPLDQKEFLYYINSFNQISVREPVIKEYIENNSSQEATVVLDPVLLHDQDFYVKYSVKPQETNYILLYYAMEKATDTVEQAVKYAKAHNLPIIELSDAPQKESPLEKYEGITYIHKYDIGPDEWMGYIQYADIIFTNSFHATCFSIIFEKLFFVGSRQGDKIKNLIEMLGLENQRINLDTELSQNTIKPIDYVSAKNKLNQQREKSINFILNALQTPSVSTVDSDYYNTHKKQINYRIFYNSQANTKTISHDYTDSEGLINKLDSGTLEFTPSKKQIKNNESSVFLRNGFIYPEYVFTGWNIRIRIKNRWYWYLEDGSFVEKKDYTSSQDKPIKLFQPGDPIPFFPLNQISTVVAEAVWKKQKKSLPDFSSLSNKLKHKLIKSLQ